VLAGPHPAIDSPSIRSDNGSGFTATAVQEWLEQVVVERLFMGQVKCRE
jgi:transposase InsO family protein